MCAAFKRVRIGHRECAKPLRPLTSGDQQRGNGTNWGFSCAAYSTPASRGGQHRYTSPSPFLLIRREMAKARQHTDTERTALMRDALHRHFVIEKSGAESAILLEEVPNTMRWAQRSADVLVFHIWQTAQQKRGGAKLEGFELKASRGDLKAELANPDKHTTLAAYCDTWTLLAFDDAVIEGLDIPESWGVTVTAGDADCRDLRVVRKPSTREPLPWPHNFIGAMIRRAHQYSPGAAYVARAVREAARVGHRDGVSDGAHTEGERWRKALIDALGPNLPAQRWGMGHSFADIVAAVKHLQPSLALSLSDPLGERPET